MGRRKVVENYQYIQTLEQYENDQVIATRHPSDKQSYTIKKLLIKDNQNEPLYKCLLSEAHLLKNIDHPSIVRFHRMLKTTNNFYLVLSQYLGTSLEEILQHGPRIMTFTQKETIAKQICLALQELHKNNIAHLCLTPEHILVTPSLAVTLKDFIYAIEIPEEGNVEQLPNKVPKTEFVAPEVRRGMGGLEADIFSFGRILQKLNFHKCKKDNKDHEKRLIELDNLIEGMLVKDLEMRATLNDVYQCFFSKLKRVKRMRSLSESNLKSSGLTRASSISRRSESVGGGKSYSEVILRVMRVRNMSWLLVQLFTRVTVGIKLNSQLTVLAGLMLLKKSTKVLAGLGKYLHYGKDEVGVEVSPKEQSKFFKTSQHHKLCEIIDREIQKQKEQLDVAVQTVFLKNSSLMKREEFARQLKEEKIDDEYFLQVVREYLGEILKRDEMLQEMAEENFADLLLMSTIISFKGVEAFFKLKILPEPVNLWDQIYMRRVKQTPRDVAIATIQQNINEQAKIVQI